MLSAAGKRSALMDVGVKIGGNRICNLEFIASAYECVSTSAARKMRKKTQTYSFQARKKSRDAQTPKVVKDSMAEKLASPRAF